MGVALRSYGRTDPLQAYTSEGYQMFDKMMDDISDDVVWCCMHIKMERKAEMVDSTTEEVQAEQVTGSISMPIRIVKESFVVTLKPTIEKESR